MAVRYDTWEVHPGMVAVKANEWLDEESVVYPSEQPHGGLAPKEDGEKPQFSKS